MRRLLNRAIAVAVGMLVSSLGIAHFYLVRPIASPETVIEQQRSLTEYVCVDVSDGSEVLRRATEDEAVTDCGTEAATEGGDYAIERVDTQSQVERTRTHEIRGSTQLRVSEADAQFILTNGSAGGGTTGGGGGGSLAVGTLQQDGEATTEQIALWLPITGTLAAGTTATTEYKLSSAGSYTTGHPLYRIDPTLSTTPAVGTVEEGFAWTIIDLEPGTSYDVRVTVDDGSTQEVKTLTTSTRAKPPACGVTTLTANSSATIASQIAALTAGDVLEIANGSYTLSAGIDIDENGTPGSPICIRGESRDGVTITYTGGRMFRLLEADYLTVENMTLVGSESDSGTSASSVAFEQTDNGYDSVNVTIRNITANGFDRFVDFHGEATGVMVYDNTAVGNNLWSTSPTNYLGSNITWNDAGIKLPGDGNEAYNNTISGFGDTFSYASHADQFVTAIGSNIHFYRNEIRNSTDDPIEVDHGKRNISWYDNRCHNCINVESLDPLYGGPWISARNIVINPYRVVTYKWNSVNTGQFRYNNTVIATVSVGTDADVAAWYNPPSSGPAQRSYGWRNNLHVYRGNGQLLWIDTSTHNPVDWTHNAWFPDRGIDWAGQGTFANLAAAQSGLSSTTPIFSGSTQRMENDVITVSNPWTDTITLGANANTEVTATYTPTLSSGDNAKNAGVAIPNVTDGFSGAAPDIGAVVAGRATPFFGDRSAAPQWFRDLSNLTWATPVSNWLGASGVKDPLADTTNAGNTGHQTVIVGWTGMGVDETRHTAFMLRNGGHQDYKGNEVYALDFREEAPAWVRLLDSTSNGSYTPPSGYPYSTHTYYEQSGGSGRWFSTHTGSSGENGFTDGNHAWEFDPDTLSWIDRGTIGNHSATGNGSSDYNPETQELVLVGDANPCVKVYDVSPGTFSLSTQLSATCSFGIYEMVAIDTTNNILLVQPNSGTTLYSLSLDNVAAGFSTFVPSGTRQIGTSQLVWHPDSNAFVGWAGGNNLTKLTVTVDGNNRYSAGAFSTVALSGTAPTDQTSNGLFDKVNLIRDMGNGQGMLVVVPRYADPDVYVIKLPSGGI